MEFPKQVMTISELAKMGFSKELVRNIALAEGFPLAFRETTSPTAAIKIDTKEFYAYLKRTSKLMERG